LKIWLKVEKMKDESLLLSKLIPSNPIPYSSIPIPLGCKVYLRTKKKCVSALKAGAWSFDFLPCKVMKINRENDILL